MRRRREAIDGKVEISGRAAWLSREAMMQQMSAYNFLYTNDIIPETIYEIKRQMWNSEPIVEILRNGESWESPLDTNFRFGRVKAAMILFSMGYIRNFVASPHPERLYADPIIQKADPDLIIQLQTFPDFTTSKGYYVDKPFLRLERIGPYKNKPRIGFGHEKAIALVLLENDLDNWLRSVNGWYR